MKHLKKITPGDICWLPKQEEIDPSNLKELKVMEKGCFNHPIVLLTVDDSGETAKICIVSEHSLTAFIFSLILQMVVI